MWLHVAAQKAAYGCSKGHLGWPWGCIWLLRGCNGLPMGLHMAGQRLHLAAEWLHLAAQGLYLAPMQQIIQKPRPTPIGVAGLL